MVVALAMPFTVSIMTGIELGFVVYVVVTLAARRVPEVPGAAWLVAALSVAKFALA
jgi:AGZA family xanthine/uracil permease-like MFS transporter